MKRAWMLILAAVLCLLVACGTEDAPELSQTTEPEQTESGTVDFGTMTILFTGDLNGNFGRDEAQGHLGYAALVAYAAQLENEGHTVFLVDGGNAADGTNDDLTNIINRVGYDFRVPGALELSEGAEVMDLDAEYLCFNRAEGDMAAYSIVTVGTVQVAFVGIGSPALPGMSQPASADAFYDAVQEAIDAASDAGADYVICITHLGADMGDAPWTAVELIAHTTGMAAVLDAGSGAVLEGVPVTDKDGFEVPLCAAGSDFCYVGKIDLNLNDGTATVTLLNRLEGEDSRLQKLTEDLEAAMKPAEDTTPTETEETTPTE